MIIIVFKAINNYPTEYLRELLELKDNTKNMTGANKLDIPNTTHFGLKSVKFSAAVT